MHKDAIEMLQKIVSKKWLILKSVIGIWEAKQEGDDVVLSVKGEQLETFNFLRQQSKKSKNNLCLSDYISPIKDYMGAFVCTAGLEIEKHAVISLSGLF